MESKYISWLVILAVVACLVDVEVGTGRIPQLRSRAAPTRPPRRAATIRTTPSPGGGTAPSVTASSHLRRERCYTSPATIAHWGTARARTGTAVMVFLLTPSIRVPVNGRITRLSVQHRLIRAGLAITPSRHFLYVANATSVASGTNTAVGVNNVVTFSVDPNTGALQRLPGAITINSPITMSIDPKGRFLYIAAYNEKTGLSELDAFSIDSTTGGLTPLPGFPVVGLYGATLAFDPTGTFLYVGGGYLFKGYSINSSTGSLTPVPGSPYYLNWYQTMAAVLVTVHPSGEHCICHRFHSKRGRFGVVRMPLWLQRRSRHGRIGSVKRRPAVCAQNLDNLVFDTRRVRASETTVELSPVAEREVDAGIGAEERLAALLPAQVEEITVPAFTEHDFADPAPKPDGARGATGWVR